MTQNAVEIVHFGRQKRGGGYEIKDFRGAIKGKAPGFLLPSLPGGGRLLVVRDVVREYVRNICGCSAEMRKTWGFLQNCRPKLSESCGKS